MADKLMSSKTGTEPDTLSSIYARLSLQLEQDKPGTFWQLSEHYGRASPGRGNPGYAVRMNSRFVAGRGCGWVAVVQQTNRFSRAMTGGRFGTARPSLANSVSRLMVFANNAARAADKANDERPRSPSRSARQRHDNTVER